MSTNSDKRARQQANRQAGDKLTTAAEVSARRRKIMTILGVVAAIIIAIVIVVALTGGGDDGSDVTTDDTTLDDAAGSTSVPVDDTDPGNTDAPAAELPAPPAGLTLTEATECPPVEGSDERVQKFAGPPPMCIDENATYTATFDTTEGSFTAQLDASATPVAVNNFVVLSRFHFYDGVPFHRIVPGFVIQGGDGDGEPWGNNDLGYEFDDELPESSAAYTDYSLAMANAGANTNGSQFFVVLPGGGAQLGPLYTRFGEVTEGREVVDTIGGLGNAQQSPTKDVVINSVTITSDEG